MTAFKFIRPTTVTDSSGSFTRSTTATYFDVDGVMQTAAIDVPRIGYDPVTHAHTGLILEGAATNLLTYSEQFDNAAWGYADVTKSANTIPAPDGATTAETLVSTITGGANTAYANQLTTVSASTTYTFSVYVKQGTSPTSLVNLYRSSPYSSVTGTITWGTTPSYVTAGGDLLGGTLTDVGGGWYRATLTMSSGTATQMVSRVYVRDQGSSNVTGHTVSVWGAQLEAGSTATSYIPTVAATVTRAADTVIGSGLIYTDVPENDYAAWLGGTTYTALTDYVIRTTATTHKVYQCLVTHTTAATPEDNLTGVTPKWLEIGPTNRWGMFDRKVGTETTQATSMTYLLKPGRANSLGLLGVDADSVEVSLVANDEIVYAASIDLNSGNSVGDWYQYFYEPIYSTDAVAITNLLDAALMAIPAYGDGVLCVRFLATAGDVTCGVLAVGLYAELGTTLYDPTIGIIDYSRKSVDAFGNYDITERTYSKRMSATLMVESTDVDNTARLLTQYRATPVVWVGADNLYSSLIVYGFAKDWEETIKGPTHSTCNIQIEGLT
jgi:hypothetical protein